MLTGLDAKRITEEAIMQRGKEKREKALEFCEKLGKEIILKAQQGRYEIEFSYEDIELKKVVDMVLKENGYTITELNNKTSVLHW